MAKKWKIASVVIAIILLALGGAMYYLMWEGDSTELRKAADSFQPDPSWIVVSKDIYPDRHVYIDGPENDSASYTWKSRSPVSREDFSNILKKSGLNGLIDGDCNPKRAPSGSGAEICSTKYTIHSYNLKVSVTAANDKPDTATINLSVHSQKGNQ